MNCQEFWESMPETGAEQSKHAAECQSCAAQLQRHAALENGLRAMSAQMRHLKAPPRVEAGLIAAFRSQQRLRTRTVPRQWWAPALSWASAAAVLVACAVLLMHPAQPLAPSHRSGSPAMEMASATQPAAVDQTADGSGQDENSGADSDGFIPLPNAQTLDPDEDVHMAIWEVPRSTMLAVGLPVSADRVSELVEADVLLGSDGIPRAIRFVDE
jgi:hypothetical protein